MKDKNKMIQGIIIGIFMFGVGMHFIGALFKILHWPYANEIITYSMIPEVIAGILILWFFLIYKKGR